jgi:DNA-binding NarL/FixJ family response regulator
VCPSIDAPTGSGGDGVIRLLIADDHPGVRRGLVELFESTADITVVAVCADGQEVLVASQHCEMDVALLDLLMPRVDGLQAARRLREDCPDVKILMFSGTTGDDRIAEARSLGAVGFVAKGTDPCALPDHVRTAASGGNLWSGPSGS